ncbi:MAG: hypothetical protein HOV94_19785 [Saccharothrix sp.]|nr:hypothetical protein [Saccharothrix sp.]
MSSAGRAATSPVEPDARRLVFGDEVTRRFARRDRDLLPPRARPAATGLTWLALGVVLLALAGLAAAIGAML